MSFNAKETGARVAGLRQERGITCVKASLDLHLSESMYRKIESGERGLSIDNLLTIAEYYGVSTDYLLTGRNSAPEIKNELSQIVNHLYRLQMMV